MFVNKILLILSSMVKVHVCIILGGFYNFNFILVFNILGHFFIFLKKKQ